MQTCISPLSLDRYPSTIPQTISKEESSGLRKREERKHTFLSILFGNFWTLYYVTGYIEYFRKLIYYTWSENVLVYEEKINYSYVEIYVKKVSVIFKTLKLFLIMQSFKLAI